MRKTVLIAGGWGYLGGRVASDLVREGAWKVRLSSRTHSTSPAWLPEAESVVMDVRRPESMPGALRDAWAVVHFAALNDPDCVKDPGYAREVNVEGTRSLVNAALAAGVERFIYFSTAHVYGAPLSGRITELSAPNPVSVYAKTHLAAEAFVLEAGLQGKMKGLVVRQSNGFGFPAHHDVDCWTLLINDLCLQAVRDRKMVLRSSGLQKRDFVTIHDVGRLIGHLLSLPAPACADGIFNMGGECTLSILDVAGRVARCCREVLGYEPEILRPRPTGQEVTTDLVYDIGKLKATGFLLKGDMDEEIRQILQMCVRASRERK